MFANEVIARSAWSYLVRSIPGGFDSQLSIDELAAWTIKLTGSLTANVNVTFPAQVAGSVWCVENGTSGSFSLTVQNTSGAGVTIAQGKRALIQWNGVDFVPLETDANLLGAATLGNNTNLTALLGIVAGITMAGGLNLAGGLGGNALTPDAFRFVASAVSYGSDADKTLLPAAYAGVHLDLTSSVPLTATRKLIVPLNGFWIVLNTTSGGQSVQVIGASGTGTTIANGKTAAVRGNGTNVVRVTADV